MSKPTVLTRRTDSSHCGKRLDLVASRLFSDYSRGRLKVWIQCGDLTVDGRVVLPRYKLAGDETLRLETIVQVEESVTPQDIPLDLLFEDEDIIIVNKPAGLVVHPAVGNRDGTLQNGLLYHDGGLSAIPRSGIVHRLDKDTTGVMVVARSLRAHTSLVKQLQTRTMKRSYEAIVHGRVPNQGRVDAPIGRHPRDRKKMAVVLSGKHAVSRFRRLRQYCPGGDVVGAGAGRSGAEAEAGSKGSGMICHIEVSLETGRTHQIRVHMTHLGHPLVGDPTYGRKFNSPRSWHADLRAAIGEFPRQALHARTLVLIHPGSGEEVRFQSELPADMVVLLNLLKECSS